jgi:hypothetical protein
MTESLVERGDPCSLKMINWNSGVVDRVERTNNLDSIVYLNKLSRNGCYAVSTVLSSKINNDRARPHG